MSMPGVEEMELRINCSDGSAVDILLDEEDLAPIRASRETARQRRQAESIRADALARLRARALDDPVLSDLLLVLGLA